MSLIKKRPLIILDFGSQYTQLIARRVREMGVYCEIHSHDLTQASVSMREPCGIILSGGPLSVTQKENPRAPDWVFTIGLPVLGICYGMQTMAVQLGGVVEASNHREFGYAELMHQGNSKLFATVFDRQSGKDAFYLDVWMSHGDHVTVLPQGFEVIAETKNAPIAAMANEIKQWYGFQFHPEVTHTRQGTALLQRFVIDICNAPVTWTVASIKNELIQQIQTEVAGNTVILGLSGGVDSSVAAALIHEAISSQLVCIFVDTGLLRLHEVEKIHDIFKVHKGLNIKIVDAKAQFLKALKGITCPEEKRKTIGRLFIEIFEQEASAFKNATYLAQGTIYSDVIESGALNADGISHVIKSHHNVGGLPAHMHLKLLEPLRILFKDEVRKLGKELGLPDNVLYQHPFPGPGLGVRVLGEIKEAYLDILRRADAIFIEELYKSGLYSKVSQAFAVFLPIKSVGVMGDGRRYDFVIALRAVETIDFMTAHWALLPWDFLSHVSNRIINEVAGISRVVYDISGKPPATIEWE